MRASLLCSGGISWSDDRYNEESENTAAWVASERAHSCLPSGRTRAKTDPAIAVRVTYVGQQNTRLVTTSRFVSPSLQCTRCSDETTSQCWRYSVQLHIYRDERTNGRADGQRDASLCPLCLSGVSILWRTNRDASDKFKTGRVKIRNKEINTRNLVS